MQELVEDLLLLACLDSGRPLEREPVDLSLLAVNAVSDAHAAAPDRTWELDLPEEPVEVPGDVAPSAPDPCQPPRQRPDPHTGRNQSSPWCGPRGPGRVGDRRRARRPETLQPRIFERFTRGDDARFGPTGRPAWG